MTLIQYKPLLANRVGFIIVHCSATKPSMNWRAADIDKAHRQRGFLEIGYHKVNGRDGRVEDGRPLDRQGAHVSGYNHLSVGVCMVGGVSEHDINVAENNFTEAQFSSLVKVLTELKAKFPHAKICGHRDIPKVAKACPSFDAIAFADEHGLA